MTNYEFYKNSDASTREMFDNFDESGFPTLDKFLAAERKWKPKYAVGDVVHAKGVRVEVIVKIDYKRERYITVSRDYFLTKLVSKFCNLGKFDAADVAVGAVGVEETLESQITKKSYTIYYCKAMLDAITEHV